MNDVPLKQDESKIWLMNIEPVRSVTGQHSSEVSPSCILAESIQV